MFGLYWAVFSQGLLLALYSGITPIEDWGTIWIQSYNTSDRSFHLTNDGISNRKISCIQGTGSGGQDFLSSYHPEQVFMVALKSKGSAEAGSKGQNVTVIRSLTKIRALWLDMIGRKGYRRRAGLWIYLKSVHGPYCHKMILFWMSDEVNWGRSVNQKPRGLVSNSKFILKTFEDSENILVWTTWPGTSHTILFLKSL